MTTTTMAPVRPLPPNTILKVAGVSFRQDAVRSVVEHDEVRIRHDQANEFDANACMVMTMGGEQLGFIPRDLAVRLAGVHPGGVWRARVQEVLRNDTWGLRVLVGPLVTEGREDAGRRSPGLRHRGPGVIEAPNGSVAVAPVEDDAPEQENAAPAPAVHVFAKSGRPLGILLGTEGTRVHVQTPSGARATYPAAVVRVATA